MIELRRKRGNWGIDNGFRDWEMGETVSPLRGSTTVEIKPGTDFPGCIASQPIVAHWKIPLMQILRLLRELVMTKTKTRSLGRQPG